MPNISHSQIIKYLNNDWLVFDESTKQFFPFVTGNKNDLPLHQNLDAEQYRGMFLHVNTSQPVSLYVNSKFTIQCPVTQTLAIPIDSLAFGQSSPILLSFYGKYNSRLIDSLAISSKKEIRYEAYTHDLNKPQTREGNMTRSYFTIMLLVCFFMFVLIRNTYTKIFDQYFSFIGLFAESGTQTSFSRATFDSYNFAFILLGIVFFALACIGFPIFGREAIGDFLPFIGNVVYLVVIGAFFYLLKYVVIFLVSWLFSIGKFSTSHYIIFVRISVMWSVILLILAMLNYSNVTWAEHLLLPSFLFSSLFFLTLTSLKVTFLINRVTKVSTLYLISYLCITEWLPYLVIVKLYMVYF
jgi:hypothetical protein